MSTEFDLIRLLRAKGFLFAASALVSGILMFPAALTTAAWADDAKPTSGSPASGSPASGSMVCLDASLIDHTKVLNDHQILFYMKGREVWVNNLQNRCIGLRYDEEFVRAGSDPRYCDNAETIKAGPTGQPCLLGKFTPYVKPAS
jgi:hypothetical protein